MTDAIVVTVDGVRTRVSTNEAVISFSMPLENADMISQLMSKVGQQVAIAMHLVGDNPKKFGMQAQALYKSGFCSNPALWEILGGDKAYLTWLKEQNCIFNKKSAEVGACEDDIVSAHFRRVNRGSGTGVKPKYSAVTMCNKHHQLQHTQGEYSLIDGRELEIIADGQLHDWAWYALKQNLGFSSMAEVPPNEIKEFAYKHGLINSLPGIYKA